MSASIAPHLARLLLRLEGSESPELRRAITELCTALDDGHVCLLPEQLGRETIERLRLCRVVGTPGEFKPLILDPAGRLYLQRYWAHEDQLARTLLHMAGEPAPAFDERVLAQGLERLLADADPAQREAAASTVRHRLSVITGGPGTGKTRTATVALALLAEQFAAARQPARFILAAPTGKAAGRLAESLTATLARLDLTPGARELLLRAEDSTLHRLLGNVPGSSEFRHHAGNPLSAAVIVVDEASMVDLPLMARFFDAVRGDTRVVLLGDKDQLASVEAGYVFGDICADLERGVAGPLRSCLTALTKNHRFDDASGIRRFAAAIQSGDFAEVAQLLREPTADFSAIAQSGNTTATLRQHILEGFHLFLTATTATEALARFADFRLLAVTRHGEFSVEHLNQLAEQTLAGAGLIEPLQRSYAGRPVLIRRNDYHLRLFNGDLGIIRPDPEQGGELRAFFAGEDGRPRSFAPARLPEHETAYAMTVHKAQGSEFRRVVLVLPPRDLELLSRELLYTGATRAREHLELFWNEAALRGALSRSARRSSGLRDRLWPG